MTNILEAAHKRSSLHRDEILASKVCGCFYCKRVFASTEVIEWYDPKGDPNGATAACPHCGIDSVIGDPPSDRQQYAEVEVHVRRGGVPYR